MKKITNLVFAFIFITLSLNAQTKKADSSTKKLSPPKIAAKKFIPPKNMEYNKEGYGLLLNVVKGDTIISVINNAGTKKITMKDWKANQEFYENKYGKLIPSPPTPPSPPPSK